MRSAYYQSPNDHLPKILGKFIVIERAKKLNIFPAQHGTSNYHSPRMIAMRENLDFQKHCSFILGECAQAENEPDRTNANAPRVLDCLFLRARESSG